MNYKKYFKDKKITVMGLGLLGRGVGDVAFLASSGADLIVTDLKSKEELAKSLKKLKRFKNIKYILGEHRLQDFEDRDFILKAAGIALDSPYIEHAKKKGIPIEMSASLFARLARASSRQAKLVSVPIIGVTGTRGKSTVTHLLHYILKTAGKKVLLGGNVLGVSTLALLRKVKSADYALFELDSWQLQGFGANHISPNISVFTTFLPDHMNYYNGNMETYFADKANIFKYQKEKDILIVGKQVKPFVKNWQKENGKIKAKFIVPPLGGRTAKWRSRLIGGHNVYNASLAVEAARRLGVEDSVIKKALKSFKGVSGRLELTREFKGIKFYNDTTATTPDATIVALKALGSLNKDGKKIILIMGGSDKGLDMKPLIEVLEKYSKAIVLLSGSGTEIIKPIVCRLKAFVGEFSNLDDSLNKAKELAKKGDIVLFSPAFASFGMFKNEFDRGERFNKFILKIR